MDRLGGLDRRVQLTPRVVQHAADAPQLASSAPLLTEIAYCSPTSSLIFSRDSRCTPASTATCACNLGPNALTDTPAGSSASAARAQPAHAKRWRATRAPQARSAADRTADRRPAHRLAARRR
jgi:hypothetical protein